MSAADPMLPQDSHPGDGCLLEVSGLRTRILGTTAVDGVRFRLTAGETYALVGESGCGKSITALSIMRLLPPGGRVLSGSVRLEGVDLLRVPERRMQALRGSQLAMIFQEPMTSLNPVLSVGDQIAEALRSRTRAVRRGRVLDLMASVGIPDPRQRIGEFPHQLSGGLMQRVMIAMALAGGPGLLIADEPTTALDVTIQAQVLELLEGLQRERGMGILLITHDLGVVAEIARRVAVMYAGQLVETGTVAGVFADPGHPYTRMLFEARPGMEKRGAPLPGGMAGGAPADIPGRGCRFAPRCVHVMAVCRDRPPPWQRLSGGHEVRCHLSLRGAMDAPPAAPPPQADAQGPGRGPVLLEVRDLKVHFPVRKGVFRRVTGHLRAVDGVSLSLREGATLALVGESGCGKSTLGKAVLRLLDGIGGSVRFEGAEISALAEGSFRPFRSRLQIVFQDPFSSLDPRMMVGDIIGEGIRVLGSGQGDETRERRVRRLLGQVGLPEEARNRYPHEFSGGQRQRICIARALAVGPRLIVCDEPTSALDVSVQAQILNLLGELQRELGLAYLFITHDISVVGYVADEVAVMYLGRIVEYGTVQEVLQGPAHPYTRALLAAVPRASPQQPGSVVSVEGEPPSPLAPPPGCPFVTRCRWRIDRCSQAWPPPVRLSGTHVVHCIRTADLPPMQEGVA